MITLLLNTKEAKKKKIQQYQPFHLLNVSIKIFTKVATNRLMGVASNMVRPSQTSFCPHRNIMEIIHELHTKKLDGVILKIDLKKAYDKVKWPFLQQILQMKGFSQKWCSWIDKFVIGGSVGIKINDDNGHYIQTKKGLRQGDPMSPILFNIVDQLLSIFNQ